MFTYVFCVEQVLPQESDVLCTHPMFGPESGKDGWKGLNFMYEKVRIRNEAICSSFLQIFESEVTSNCIQYSYYLLLLPSIETLKSIQYCNSPSPYIHKRPLYKFN